MFGAVDATSSCAVSRGRVMAVLIGGAVVIGRIGNSGRDCC